jgi:glutamine synthetase
MADVEFEIEKKDVDTLMVVFSDLQGRLVGRRVTTDFFTSEALPHGLPVPAHLLSTDATGRLTGSFALSSPDNGYRDLILRIDTSTLFRMPWEQGTVGVLGDLEFPDGTVVTMSPRAILRRQLERFDTVGLSALLAANTQFTVVGDSPAHLEPLLRQIRQALTAIPVPISGTMALPAPGHVELEVRPGDPLQVCDGLVKLRAATTEIAGLEGMTATFMAAYQPGTGSAAPLSLTMRGQRGGMALADRYGDHGLSEVGKAFVAGQLEHAAELCVLYAPTVNSYRRFGADPFSPSAVNWGQDNRTCAIRVVGWDANLYVENRLPGSDANPYLATAAMIAAGMDGVSHQLHVPPPIEGDGHDAGSPPLPRTLAEALDAWVSSTWVTATFGPEVQSHIATAARIEVEAAGATDDLAWERARYFGAG